MDCGDAGASEYTGRLMRDLIVPQLAADGFRMLHVGRDSDGIHQELLSLEKYMGQVTDLLAGKARI